ncbi:MAG: hypothetical protein H6739_19590 [Alphaproteobacteria bacterium]|nr:hypothetical protein [Alphaproteobacteria bacterium]
MKPARVLALLGLLALPVTAGARPPAPSTKAVAAMDVAALRALRGSTAGTVETLRTMLLGATTQSDVEAIEVSLRTALGDVDAILAGLAEPLRAAGEDKDTVAAIQADYQGMRSCLSDMIAGAEGDFADLQALFGARYGQGETLETWIEGDTEGRYKRLLLRGCGY